jgi:hypothetical protein
LFQEDKEEVMIKLMKIIGITLLLNFVILLVGMSNSNASEHNSLLKGEYDFSTTRVCVGGPFNSDLSKKQDGAYFDLGFIEAIVNFNGDGTGTATFTSALFIKPTQTYEGQFPVSHGYGSGTITYDVYDNKTFTVEMVVTSWTTTVGPPSTTVTLDGIQLEGTIAHGNHLLLMSDTQPNIEIGTRENGSKWERICGRRNTTIRQRLY